MYIQGKNCFAEVSENLVTDLKIILLNYQNNYVKRSNWLREYQNFLHHCSSFLSVLHDYFNDPKLFSDLYLIKFFNISAKSFFSCKHAKFATCPKSLILRSDY